MHRCSLLVLLLLFVIVSLLFHSSFQRRTKSLLLDNKNYLKHRLLLAESKCIERCIKTIRLTSKCQSICSAIVTREEAFEQLLEQTLLEEARANKRQQDIMSDLDAEGQQLEATRRLWELYYKQLTSILTNGGWSPGFQILENSIELTDIRSQIPGWDSMPLSSINKASASDYDNPSILGQEMILSSKPGPFRNSDGSKWIDEYKSFLSGVKGVSSVDIPNPDTSLSAKRTLEYEWALNNCTVNYESASPVTQAKFDLERYTNTFCPQVKTTENAMYAQIGKDQAAIGEKTDFAAAVALGMARGLYTVSTAFKKYQSFRAMEYECIMAQEEKRPLRGNAKSISFNYNHRTWKNTQESNSFSFSVGFGLFNLNTNFGKETIKGLDLTAIGGVDIAFDDFKYVPLYPGDWYSSTALRDFRYAEREAKSSPISRYFGEQGTLTLMPKGLYVAVNPSISLSIKTEKVETFKQKTNLSVGVGLTIYGINFGGQYGHAKFVDQGTDSSGFSKITMKSDSCRPQLFAVENHYFY